MHLDMLNISWGTLLWHSATGPTPVAGCMGVCKQVSMVLEGLCNMIAESVSEKHIVTEPPLPVRLSMFGDGLPIEWPFAHRIFDQMLGGIARTSVW